MNEESRLEVGSSCSEALYMRTGDTNQQLSSGSLRRIRSVGAGKLV